MINSFQSISTITSGLLLEQVEEDVVASNLAQTSVDSNGYLENSLEQVNAGTASYITYEGSNGLVSVGTGTTVESITRLRSSFLDNQIQQESSVVGYNSVFYGASGTGVMSEISDIVNGTTTLSSSLSSFTTAWSNLSADPTSTSLQSAVVTAGENFASEANSEYTQLENLQTNLTSQISTTVTQINQILQQLAGVNKEILNSSGSNENSLLDARDYDLDKLSQLTNFQATYNSTGTVNVWLNGLSLVDESGAAILNVNATNYTNTTQSDVTIQSSQGSVTVANASSLITGGSLGGELEARDVVVQSYMNQINEVASSVLTMTNNLYEAGYVANSTSTGTAFFTGSNASNIAVNGAIANAATASPFLATEVDPNSSTGQLAGFLSNIQNLLAGNFLTTATTVSAGTVVDPTVAISTSIGVTATGGTFTINGTTISYTAGDSIDNILSQLNSISGVNAVFNSTTKKIEIYSNTPLTYVGTGGDNFKWANLESVLESTMPINDTTAENEAIVDYGNESVSANYSVTGPPVTGPNSIAFLITPSADGAFTVDGKVISWNNTESLNAIFTSASFPSTVRPNWTQGAQKIELLNSTSTTATPITVTDVSGNLMTALGLTDSSTPIGDLASNITTDLSNQTSAYESAYTSSTDSLTQLNTEQDDIAGVSTGTGVAGVSTSTLEAEAEEDMIIYNAMLEVMEVIDQTLDALVGIPGTSDEGIFQQQTTAS